jgi:hypothetical protein
MPLRNHLVLLRFEADFLTDGLGQRLQYSGVLGKDLAVLEEDALNPSETLRVNQIHFPLLCLEGCLSLKEGHLGLSKGGVSLEHLLLSPLSVLLKPLKTIQPFHPLFAPTISVSLCSGHVTSP